MGNCINYSSSASTARHDLEPEGASPCDERTIDTLSNATISPPASPSSQAQADTITGEHVNAASHHTLSSPQTPDGKASDVEQQREDGQKRLKEIVVSSAKTGDIDWKSVIALADDLHRKEQELLRSYNEQRFGNKLAASTRGRSSDISRKQAFFEKRRRRREISRRRKLESVGSFSVNLYMYEKDGRGQSMHSPLNENDESRESAAADPDGRNDIFQDDDLSPLCHGISYTTSPRRSTIETQRPDTPSPFVRSRTDSGSFMAAVSSDSTKDIECSSNSSSDSSTSTRRENWDLMTIDENVTVTEWK